MFGEPPYDTTGILTFEVRPWYRNVEFTTTFDPGRVTESAEKVKSAGIVIR